MYLVNTVLILQLVITVQYIVMSPDEYIILAIWLPWQPFLAGNCGFHGYQVHETLNGRAQRQYNVYIHV